MTRRTIIILLATLSLTLTVAVVAPQPAQAGLSFVDKQVVAGAMIIQKYVDEYGVDHQFTYPPKSMVNKKGLKGSNIIWPSNPWTGKDMASGSKKGMYTYKLRDEGRAYTLTVHLSRTYPPLTGGMPRWLKNERDTDSKQNALLLQRYLEAYRMTYGDYPAPANVNAAAPAGVMPTNPWTGAAMAASDALGDFRYTGGGSTYTLRVRLAKDWSTPYGPLSLLARLTTTPGD